MNDDDDDDGDEMAMSNDEIDVNDNNSQRSTSKRDILEFHEEEATVDSQSSSPQNYTHEKVNVQES